MEIPTDWTFKSSNIAIGFDKHVREQLPWYDLMSGAVAHIARHYIPIGGTVYDLGCSTGNIGRLLADIVASRNAKFVGIDNSEAMWDRYIGPGQFILANLEEFEFEPFDVAIAFLCLMFISPEKRKALLSRLRLKRKDGGALIVVDKMNPRGGYIGQVLSRLTLAGKIAAGVSSDEILAKEISLSGIQRPMVESELGDAVEVFRFGDFAGWVIE